MSVLSRMYSVALTVEGMVGMLLTLILAKAVSEEAVRTSPVQGSIK